MQLIIIIIKNIQHDQCIPIYEQMGGFFLVIKKDTLRQV